MRKNLQPMAQHQVKTQWYYWFWGAATVTVFCGQMYVGIGYRQMAEAVWSVVDVVSAVREPFDDDIIVYAEFITKCFGNGCLSDACCST